MARVLVTEAIADNGLQRLRDAGHEVDIQLDWTPESLLDLVKGAHALIIRSATQVTAEVLAAGTDLIVVGRAGIGLDNVDTGAATDRGVMVVNAPTSNIISAAELTVGHILSLARHIPVAHASLAEGLWKRSKYTGVELYDPATNTWAATTVRDTEGFVQIQVADVTAEFTWTRNTHQRIHIRAVNINLTTVSVDDFAEFFNAFFKHTVS